MSEAEAQTTNGERDAKEAIRGNGTEGKEINKDSANAIAEELVRDAFAWWIPEEFLHLTRDRLCELFELAGFQPDQIKIGILAQEPEEHIRIKQGKIVKLVAEDFRVAPGGYDEKYTYAKRRAFAMVEIFFDDLVMTLSRTRESLVRLISENRNLKIENHQLEILACTDLLTAVGSPRAWEQNAEKMVKECRDRSEPISIMVCDVNDLKKINDGHGHPEGNALLIMFTSILQECLRPTDLICRMGGDEFFVLLPNTTPQEAALIAHQIKERQRLAILCYEEDDKISNRFSSLSASVGITGLPNNEELPIGVKRADQFMYAHKQAYKKEDVLRRLPQKLDPPVYGEKATDKFISSVTEGRLISSSDIAKLRSNIDMIRLLSIEKSWPDVNSLLKKMFKAEEGEGANRRNQ